MISWLLTPLKHRFSENQGPGYRSDFCIVTPATSPKECSCLLALPPSRFTNKLFRTSPFRIKSN
jgi:hypothetical protein